MPTPYERLKRWRDVGDGPIGYTAGNGNFGADVSALLAQVERYRSRLITASKLRYAMEHAGFVVSNSEIEAICRKLGIDHS